MPWVCAQKVDAENPVTGEITIIGIMDMKQLLDFGIVINIATKLALFTFAAKLAQTAFSLQVGQIAGPVATELGYHVIQVMEIADRPVEPERRVYIAQTRFDNWLQPLYAKAVIERYGG